MSEHTTPAPSRLTRRRWLKTATSASVATTFALNTTAEADTNTSAQTQDYARALRALVDRSDANVARIEKFSITPKDLPWDKKIGDIRAGQAVTFFLSGYWYVHKGTNRWYDAGFVFFPRVNDGSKASPTQNIMGNTGTLTAPFNGQLELARSAGEFASPKGDIWVSEDVYTSGRGQIEGAAIVWDEDPGAGLHKLSAIGDVDGLITQEINHRRLAQFAPAGWSSLFHFGEAGEVFSQTAEGVIVCDTHKNVGIIQYPIVDMPLEPGLELDWRWQVDLLPFYADERDLLSHDYVAIAVAFDDGQNITYTWSGGLPLHTSFRCPIPGWDKVETHIVQRSGSAELGQMLDESTDVYSDYRKLVGGEATQVTQVWLLGVSLFQRGHGKCRFSQISLKNCDKTRKIL